MKMLLIGIKVNIGLTLLESMDDWELMVILVTALIRGEEVKCENGFLGAENDIGTKYSNNGAFDLECV